MNKLFKNLVFLLSSVLFLFSCEINFADLSNKDISDNDILTDKYNSENVPSGSLPNISPTAPSAIISTGQIPNSLTGYDKSAQAIFGSYNPGAAVIPRYVLPGGTGDGSSWNKAAGNLRTVLEEITDASADKVYAVLLGPGVYKPGAPMGMKNYVTVVGGVSRDNSIPADIAGLTTLSGENTYRVFYNDHTEQNPLTSTSRLYGVTITGGYAADGYGGGMASSYSSLVLTEVVFSGNTADQGGGMFNYQSTPLLTRVVFSGNTATSYGGGMFNFESAPVLNKVIFTGNIANHGGGIGNVFSTPVLAGVIFSGNTANGIYGSGGGIFNLRSAPLLTGVVLSGNTANTSGSGMYNHLTTLVAVNSIFWGDSLSGSGILSGSADFYYSVVQGSSSDSINHIVTNDPGFAALADNGGGALTMAIPADSPAMNKGIYVRRSAVTTGSIDLYGHDVPIFSLYYSIDNSTWYDTPKLSNDGDAAIALPADTIDLTETDMTGHAINDRPDIGVYEAR